MNNTHDTPRAGAIWIAGVLCGALAMFLLDPDTGGERRARLGAGMRQARGRTGSTLGHVLADLATGVSRAGGPLGPSGVTRPRAPLSTLLGLAGLLIAARGREPAPLVDAGREEPLAAIPGPDAQLRRIDQRLH